MIAASDMRASAGDHAFVELAPACDTDALIVEEVALAALGGIEFVIGGIVDHAGNDGSFALKPDRDRKLRNAVQEVGGAVERIDDPGVGLVVARARAAFFTDKAVTGARLGEVLVQHLLGAAIGHGDEVGRPLQRYLKIFDFAEVALEATTGAARRLDHDVEEG